MVKVFFSDNNSDVFEWNWLIFGTLIDIYVRYSTKEEYYNSVPILSKLSPLELGKIFGYSVFSDNNSYVFEWNWLIFGTIIDTYLRYCTKQEL